MTAKDEGAEHDGQKLKTVEFVKKCEPLYRDHLAIMVNLSTDAVSRLATIKRFN